MPNRSKCELDYLAEIRDLLKILVGKLEYLTHKRGPKPQERGPMPSGSALTMAANRQREQGPFLAWPNLFVDEKVCFQICTWQTNHLCGYVDPTWYKECDRRRTAPLNGDDISENRKVMAKHLKEKLENEDFETDTNNRRKV